MKTLLKPLLLLAGLLLISSAAFADPSVTNDNPVSNFLPQLFNVPQTDESFSLLGMLFGGMGDVLPGAPNVMGAMFAKFNSAMLLLGTLVLLYTFIFGLIGTAYEGEFLGKKFSTVWTPIRVILGIMTLLPMKSGYCFLQIILMWVVIQGIGAANAVWTAAVQSIEIHGIYNEDNVQSANAKNDAGSYSYAMASTSLANEQVLQNFVCVYETYQGKKAYLDIPPAIIDTNKSTLTYNFPTYEADGKTIKNATACGSISMPYHQDTKNNLAWEVENSIGDSMSDVFGVLNDAAQTWTHCPDRGNPASCLKGQQPLAAANKYVADHVTQAISSWYEKNSDSAAPPQEKDTAIKQEIDNSLSLGWIYAGAFYRQLTLLQPGSLMTAGYSNVDYSKRPDKQYTSGYTPLEPDDIASLEQSVNPGGLSPQEGNVSVQKLAFGSGGAGLGNVINPINVLANAAIAIFTHYLSGYNAQTRMLSFQSGSDPIMGIQIMGTQILDLVGDAFTTAFYFALMLMVLGSLIPCASFFGPLALKLLGWMVGLMAMFYGVALIMEGYIPLIPYLVFFFASIGWLIAVVETMLAAPLVALGIVYPEGGHELLGRASPAVMLITNVFIRPTLMVFGFVAGILLSYVSLSLFNSAYQFVLFGASLTKASDTPSSLPSLSPFVWLLYMMIYVSVVMVIVNKCYALTHKLPDQILRWIGGTHGFGEYSGGVEEVAQKAQSGASQIGQTVGKTETGTLDKLSSPSNFADSSSGGDGDGSSGGDGGAMTASEAGEAAAMA